MSRERKIKYIKNATSEKTWPAFAPQSAEKTPISKKNPQPAIPYLCNIKPTVHINQASKEIKQPDKQTKPPIKQNRKATVKKSKLAEDPANLYYKKRILSKAASQYNPDPIHSLHRIEKNIHFSSYKWIYNEIVRKAPSLKPYVEQIRALPRPKRDEINQLIELYHKGNADALDELLSYYYRVCLKAALRVSMAIHTDLEETVCEANLRLLTLLPKLIRKENNLSFLQRHLERELKRSLAPVWMYFPLNQGELERAIIAREIMENAAIDYDETDNIPENIQQQIEHSISNKWSDSRAKTTESIQNVLAQNVLYIDEPFSKAEICKFQHIREYDLQTRYDYQNEDETTEPLEISFDNIYVSDFISIDSNLTEEIYK